MRTDIQYLVDFLRYTINELSERGRRGFDFRKEYIWVTHPDRLIFLDS